MLRPITVTIVMLTLALFVAGPALAAEKEGRVKTVDAAERSITLDDGMKLWLGDRVNTDSLKEGSMVKLSYEERDGKAIATDVEVK